MADAEGKRPLLTRARHRTPCPVRRERHAYRVIDPTERRDHHGGDCWRSQRPRRSHRSRWSVARFNGDEPAHALAGNDNRRSTTRARRHCSGLALGAAPARKAQGKHLGKPTNIGEAGDLGRHAAKESAARFAANVLPIIASVQATGITTLAGIAHVLNGRGIRTARGGRRHVSTVRNLLSRAAST